jgi:hypothetical protein
MGHELRVHFPQWCQYYYQIECAWCKKCLGWKLKNVSVPGDTTYGICPPCVVAMVSKISSMPKSLPSPGEIGAPDILPEPTPTQEQREILSNEGPI